MRFEKRGGEATRGDVLVRVTLCCAGCAGCAVFCAFSTDNWLL
jgi:hypothetical protein